jgi:hypothetical protein
VGVDALIERSGVGNFHFQCAHGGNGVVADYPEKAGPGDFDTLSSGELAQSRELLVFIYI